MATTPLIRPLQVSGGTFYTFTSSAEDLGLTFNNDTKKFVFSKYALLKLPHVSTPVYADNRIQFGCIDGALLDQATFMGTDDNTNFANSFQSYCLNLEATVVSEATYDRNLKLNPAERVFWKWLKELGAIRWRDASSAEATTLPRYTEEDEVLTGAARYDRVVQYLGSIDVVNNVQNNVNAYTEVYIHVPTAHGNTPLVLFNTVEDANYFPAMVLRHEPGDPLDVEYLYGRHWDDVHPAGLTTLALYDQDTLGLPTSNIWTGSWTPGNWYDAIGFGPNAYFTDATFADTTVDRLQKTDGLVTVEYRRSRLDGVVLEWDPTLYAPIVANSSITTLEEFNATATSVPFDFNVVLVYYDVYDPNNTSDRQTNLYGVLFLENIEQVDLEFGIPLFSKFKPNKVTKLNGNSYGFKLNLKFDTSADNVGVEAAINDFSSFSMELFTDTMSMLQNAVTVITDQIQEIVNMKAELAEVRDLVLNVDQYAEIDQRIAELEASFQTSAALFSDSTAIMGLIEKNSDELANVLAGQTSLEVSYNLDAVKAGEGASVDRSTPNIVRVSTTVQAFNFGTDYQGDMSAGGVITLQPYTNYFRHYDSGLPHIAAGDISVYLDDTLTTWRRGQCVRLVFEDPIDMDAHSLVLYTDAPNRLGSGSYGIIMGAITSAEFDAASDRPIFDITCVDATALTFVIDQIR